MSGINSRKSPAPGATTVRVVISHPTDVVASPKGLHLEGNLLTWAWIDTARRTVFPPPEKPMKPKKSGATKKA